MAPTGVVWLDRAVADAKLPQTVDTEGGCLIVGQLEGRVPSPETFRRWPIKYRLVGKIRLYEVEHVLEFVRKRFKETPLRLPAAQSRLIRSREPESSFTAQNHPPRLFGGRSPKAAQEAKTTSEEFTRQKGRAQGWLECSASKSRNARDDHGSRRKVKIRE
jgi:hypothetical protein